MFVKFFALYLLCGLPAAAQDRVAANSAAAQQDSLAKQRLSIQQQLRSTSNSSFFSLPPPEPTGTIAAAVPAASADCDPLAEDELKALIEDASGREGVKPDLLRSIIRQESAARPCAVSAKGAQGLMQ